MAISNAIPEIWSARLYHTLYRQNVWMNTITDHSQEVEDGNKLNLTKLSASVVNVRDYSKDTDFANAPDVGTDSRETLDLNQQKYFNVYVDDIDRVQSRPDIMDGILYQAGRLIAQAVDLNIRTETLDSLPAASKATYTREPANQSKAWREGLVFDILNTKTTRIKQNWPRDMIKLVIGARVEGAIIRYMIENGIGGDRLATDALRAGEMGRFLGLDVYVDTNIDDSANTLGNTLYVMCTTDSVVYAGQIQQMEFYRPEKRFGDAVKGLYVYGSERLYDERVVHVTQA